MNIEKIPVDTEARKAEWLALRDQDVTASDIATLLSVDAHPYRTPRRLWEVKAGHIRERIKDNRQLLRGRLMEPIVRKIIMDDHPTWQVIPGAHYYRDPEARLGATPDAFIIRPDREGFGNCQIKTAGQWAFKKSWIVEDDEPDIDQDGDPVRTIVPPAWIMAQSILEGHLTGASWDCVAVVEMSDGLDLTIVDVPREPRVVENMYAKAAEFWASIATGVPPPFDWLRDEGLIGQLFAEERRPDLLDAMGDPAVEAALQDHACGKAMIATGQDLKQRATSILKNAIGDAPGLTFDRARVTWKTQVKPRTALGPGSITRVLRVNDRRQDGAHSPQAHEAIDVF
ncbi:MAG: Endonuclease [Hyphomicrobiales bacterium]|nr:Endonuclease [Hyphomicrobiales bacterium]